jgi:hypothetical protein
METEGSLPCSYFFLPEPDGSDLHTPILLSFLLDAFMLSSYLRLDLSSCLFISGFRAKILYAFSTVVWLVEALCYKPEGREFDSRWG